MLFNSFAFLFAFLPITYAVFWMLPRASARYIWLAVTGYVFYSYWNPWFCLLMAFSTLVSVSAPSPPSTTNRFDVTCATSQ